MCRCRSTQRPSYTPRLRRHRVPPGRCSRSMVCIMLRNASPCPVTGNNRTSPEPTISLTSESPMAATAAAAAEVAAGSPVVARASVSGAPSPTARPDEALPIAPPPAPELPRASSTVRTARAIWSASLPLPSTTTIGKRAFTAALISFLLIPPPLARRATVGIRRAAMAPATANMVLVSPPHSLAGTSTKWLWCGSSGEDEAAAAGVAGGGPPGRVTKPAGQTPRARTPVPSTGPDEAMLPATLEEPAPPCAIGVDGIVADAEAKPVAAAAAA